MMQRRRREEEGGGGRDVGASCAGTVVEDRKKIGKFPAEGCLFRSSSSKREQQSSSSAIGNILITITWQ
jgi:hypothetical protein